MSGVFDFAKYFIKQNLDTSQNTFDGNMKLQKLLVFANLILLAERDMPLFDDEVLAFKHGCVIEKVRLRYKNDYPGFAADSRAFNPDFSQEEYDVLNLTVSLFGHLSARELSDLNHALPFWEETFLKSGDDTGLMDKKGAAVSPDMMRKDLDRFKIVLQAYRESQSENQAREVINDVVFFYTPNYPALSDEIYEQLYKFSLSATEQAYSISVDDERLVIY